MRRHATAFLRFWLLIAAVMLLGAERLLAESRSAGGARLNVRVADAVLLKDPRTVRVFGAPSELTLVLNIANDSQKPLLFPHASLSEQIRFALQRGETVPVAASWTTEADAPIEPGKASEWTIVLTRADQRPFKAGRYVLDVVMRGSLRKAGTLQVRLDVGAPANPRETATSFRLQAEKIQQENSTEAIALLHLALATDPAASENSVALGDSYIRAGRYEEAIPFFERALDLLAQDRRSIHYRLALAYVGAGDEAAAERVLRDARLSESSIKDNLARYRQTVAGR